MVCTEGPDEPEQCAVDSMSSMTVAADSGWAWASGRTGLGNRAWGLTAGSVTVHLRIRGELKKDHVS